MNLYSYTFYKFTDKITVIIINIIKLRWQARPPFSYLEQARFIL